MENEERNANKAIMLLAVACLIIFIVLANSCRTVQVVTEYRDRITHDTTEIVDSVYIDKYHTIMQKGDTIFKVDSIYINKYKVLEKKVDVYVHDSIPYPVEVVKEKKVTSGFGRFCIGFFWAFVLGLAALIAWRCFKL